MVPLPRCTRRRADVDPTGAAAARLLLQIFYSVRSVALLIEQLDYNLLFHWFVGLAIDDPVWSPRRSARTATADRGADVAQGFFTQVWRRPKPSKCCPTSTTASTAR